MITILDIFLFLVCSFLIFDKIKGMEKEVKKQGKEITLLSKYEKALEKLVDADEKIKTLEGDVIYYKKRVSQNTLHIKK